MQQTDDRLITLKHAKQIPVVRYSDSRIKKLNRIANNLSEVDSAQKAIDNLIPLLREARYSAMANFLVWARIDPLSNDSQIAIRAANLLLHKQKTAAQFWMKLITGLMVLDEDSGSGYKSRSQDNPHKFTESVEGWNEK